MLEMIQSEKAESIRDIVKSVAFVQNALKREVYLKEVSNKFGLSEQSLFNELQIQTNVTQQQESKPRFEEKSSTKTGNRSGSWFLC
jgi:DNA primase